MSAQRGQQRRQEKESDVRTLRKRSPGAGREERPADEGELEAEEPVTTEPLRDAAGFDDDATGRTLHTVFAVARQNDTADWEGDEAGRVVDDGDAEVAVVAGDSAFPNAALPDSAD